MKTEISLYKPSFNLADHISAIDELINEYEFKIDLIDKTVTFAKSYTVNSVIHYFLEGNKKDDRSYGSFDDVFNRDGALKELNATYWGLMMNTTRIMDILPAERKNKWNEMIQERKTPDFNRSLVYDTISALTSQEERFFAERIDGLFQKLSRDHVTNVPEGFSKRMIFNNIIDNWEYSFMNYEMINYIDDLRRVIAKVFSVDNDDGALPIRTDDVIKYAQSEYGDWVFVDGGSMKIKVFKKGTVHIEIHPEVAFALNRELAKVNPSAIPSEFRTKAKVKAKEFPLLIKPISYKVLSAIASLKETRYRNPNKIQWGTEFKYDSNSRCLFKSLNLDKAIVKQVDEIMHSIGATTMKFPYGVNEGIQRFYKFNSDPKQMINRILTTAMIPDDVSFQFYPTPEEISEYAATVLDVQDSDSVLEPSAGTGALIHTLKSTNVTAVEVSELRCEGLKELSQCKTVVNADFLKWETDAMFDKIIMNPPYSDGRLNLHIDKALTLLKEGGKLVAIVPLSFNRDGFETLKQFDNCFQNTGISVKVVKFNKE